MKQRHDASSDAAVRERLREALEHRGLSQRKLAGLTGLGENTISGIFNGKQRPQSDSLRLICKHLKTNSAWLLSGVGPPYAAPDGTVPGLESPQSRLVLGIDQWLADSSDGNATNADEQAWLRAIPWPAPHIRHPDIVYNLVLTAYRQAKVSIGSHIRLAP